MTIDILISHEGAVFRIHFTGLPEDTRDDGNTRSQKQRDKGRGGDAETDQALAHRRVQGDPDAE
ncbi:hypothetical protein D3C86_2218230 [compost metagenome]